MSRELRALIEKHRKIIQECPDEHREQWQHVFEAVSTVLDEFAALAAAEDAPPVATLSAKALGRLLEDVEMDEIKRPLPHKVEHDIPRRCRIDLATPVENAIREARQMVEAMPADVRLTDATVLLGNALDRVADYLEDVAAQPPQAPQEQTEGITLNLKSKGFEVARPASAKPQEPGLSQFKQMEVTATVALDEGTRRSCNHKDCGHDFPCPIHDVLPGETVKHREPEP